MKAIVLNNYGPPEDLRLEELKRPIPKPHEVLVKIYATAVNDYDWSMVRGKPYLYRLMYGLRKPKARIPGMELSGIIVAVGGEAVNIFKKGDAVYGDISGYGFGSFAEFLCIDARALRHKPMEMSFEEAASIPHASLLALQGLRDIGKIQSGQKLLLNGAGGGVGTFAFQLAKLHNCEVIGVDTGEKLQMMKALGFDQVIDYKKEDFTKSGECYDLILDCKTSRSPFAYLRVLKPNGNYVTVGGGLFRLLQIFLLGKLILFFSKKNLKMLALQPNKGLDDIEERYLEEKLKCVIDGPYPLAEAPARIRYFGEGKHQGKVVLTV